MLSKTVYDNSMTVFNKCHILNFLNTALQLQQRFANALAVYKAVIF